MPPTARTRSSDDGPWGWRVAWLALVGVVFTAILTAGLSLRSPLLRLEAPQPGEVVGMAGLEVLIRFPDAERVAPETLRVLLNGADVTEGFTAGENGAFATLFALLDGENLLRVEVFGRARWPSSWFVEQTREVLVLGRRPLDLDRG